MKECDQITQPTNLAESVPPDEWQRHFKTLSSNDNVYTDLDRKLCELEKKKFAHNKTSLDFPFNMKEIKQAIKSSKSCKSPSDDLLLNEMFKCSMNHILPALTKLFNLILNAQYFPNFWNIAYE